MKQLSNVWGKKPKNALYLFIELQIKDDTN